MNSPTVPSTSRALHPDTWRGKRVLVTGHTGFKGGWLAIWLAKLGANVSGLALPPDSEPSLYEDLNVGEVIASHFADIRESALVTEYVQRCVPEVVFHLAAQPLVRRSYAHPVETLATNVMGTAHLLEAVRATPSVRAVVVVTSDKCYENHEWHWAYREIDRLGGHDPYSSSKAAAELVASSFRDSFFSERAIDRHPGLVASARSGNVIGGGDWSADRLIPDVVRAMARGEPITLRYPVATRPWQHVLEPLHGYLAIATRLLEGDQECASAWNFGPSADDERTVAWIVDAFQQAWNADPLGWRQQEETTHHEAGRLALDWSKARVQLGWRPQWTARQAVEQTASWYRARAQGASRATMRALMNHQIEQFTALVLQTRGETAA